MSSNFSQICIKMFLSIYNIVNLRLDPIQSLRYARCVEQLALTHDSDPSSRPLGRSYLNYCCC